MRLNFMLVARAALLLSCSPPHASSPESRGLPQLLSFRVLSCARFAPVFTTDLVSLPRCVRVHCFGLRYNHCLAGSGPLLFHNHVLLVCFPLPRLPRSHIYMLFWGRQTRIRVLPRSSRLQSHVFPLAGNFLTASISLNAALSSTIELTSATPCRVEEMPPIGAAT